MRINVLQKSKKKTSKEGQQIWYAINEYVELVESTRFKDFETPHMTTFLSGARRGIVDKILLNKMNGRVVTTVASAKKMRDQMQFGYHIEVKK